MKIFIFVLGMLFIPDNSYAQQESLPKLEAHFSAFIVKDMSASIAWYSDMFGFKVLDKKEFPDVGFKQSNLNRGAVNIELIELNSALSPEDVIPNYNSKTRLIGIFKTGFLISEFDKFIRHLTQKSIAFHGQIVKNEASSKRMVIVKDPDGNRIQLFEN
jgi:catechol 2,3-dioxygenase-like lactoylglutathione lyase family enzyme